MPIQVALLGAAGAMGTRASNTLSRHPDEFHVLHVEATGDGEQRLQDRGVTAVPLDEATVRAAAVRLKEENVESVAVALLWSIVNSGHEQRVKAILNEELPDVPVVLSSDVLPMIREWGMKPALHR